MHEQKHYIYIYRCIIYVYMHYTCIDASDMYLQLSKQLTVVQYTESFTERPCIYEMLYNLKYACVETIYMFRCIRYVQFCTCIDAIYMYRCIEQVQLFQSYNCGFAIQRVFLLARTDESRARHLYTICAHRCVFATKFRHVLSERLRLSA